MYMRVLALGAVAVAFAVGCGSSGDDDREDAMNTCRASAADKLLKNRDSAAFRNVAAELKKWPAEGGGQMDYWDVTGEISGENAFGARGEYNKWVCVAVPHDDGPLEVTQVYMR